MKEANDIGSSVKLTPGDKRLGAIVFMLPNGSTPDQFLFTTDSGFGNTGKWTL